MNPSNADAQQLLAALAAIDFADRYYALCAKFAKTGPAMPIQEQRALIDDLGRGFTYDKREKFFACRDAGAPGPEIGLNVIFRDSAIELVLVVAVPSGKFGGPFSELAQSVKRLADADYKHTPPYPRVKYVSTTEARDALVASLELYDAASTAVRGRMQA